MVKLRPPGRRSEGSGRENVPTAVGKRLDYDGRLQGVADGQAIGWAWNPSEPDRSIEVAVAVDGEVVCEGLADVVREDLEQEGVTGAAHGFCLNLPQRLTQLAEHRIVALVGSERVEMVKSPSFWCETTPDSPWTGVSFSYGTSSRPAVEVAPAPEAAPLRALVGREHWLFDARELGCEPEPDEETLQRLTARLSAVAGECAAIGVPYVLACVPDKLEVLAPFGPDGAPVRRPWLPSVRARMRDVDGVDLLDLLPVLVDALGHGPSYQRTDAVWNDLGAFFVVRALLKEAAKRAPTLRPPPLSSLHTVRRHGYRGPLADCPKVRLDAGRLVAGEVPVPDEEAIGVDAGRLTARRMPVARHLITPAVHVRLYGRADGSENPRVAVVGGAACLPLIPWIAEAADRTSFFWTRMPPMEPIELEMPDCVLHLVDARDLAAVARPDASEAMA